MSDVDGDTPVAPGPEAAASAEDVADRRAGDESTESEKPDLLTYVADAVNDCFKDDPGGARGSGE